MSTLLARRFSSSFRIIGSSTSAFWRMFLVVVLPPPVGPTSITPCRTITWLYSCLTFSTCWGQYCSPRSRIDIEMAFYKSVGSNVPVECTMVFTRWQDCRLLMCFTFTRWQQCHLLFPQVSIRGKTTVDLPVYCFT